MPVICLRMVYYKLNYPHEGLNGGIQRVSRETFASAFREN